MLGPKVPAWRSEPYRRFVASQPCFACGIEDQSQCAHANSGKGLAIKVDDSRTFPLCASSPMRVGCHARHDMSMDGTRDDRRLQEARWIARMQKIAKADGWLKHIA